MTFCAACVFVWLAVFCFTGRNFPRRPECTLEIEARFNGEVLCTDPLPHSGGALVIDNELAWEMTRKALQQHKLNRTPIKLQVWREEREREKEKRKGGGGGRGREGKGRKERKRGREEGECGEGEGEGGGMEGVRERKERKKVSV